MIGGFFEVPSELKHFNRLFAVECFFYLVFEPLNKNGQFGLHGRVVPLPPVGTTDRTLTSYSQNVRE
jgi:hypothetical protein